MRVELEGLVGSVDGDGDGSDGGQSFLQLVLVVLFDVDETNVGSTDVLLAEPGNRINVQLRDHILNNIFVT